MDKYLWFFRKSKSNQDSAPEAVNVLSERKEQYAALLYSLAEGLNPITGEEFGEGVMDQPDIIRALYAGANALSGKSREKKKSNRNPNAGEKWTAEDDASLMAEYSNGASIKNLSKMFGRSELAIRMHIDKLAEKADIAEEYKKRVMQNRKIR